MHFPPSAGLIFLAAALAQGAQAAIEKSKPAVVSVLKVEPVELADTLSYPARVIPKVNTTVLAEADGIVAAIHAPLGQKLSKGQKILTLKHTDPVYQYAPIQMTSPVAGVVSAMEVTEGSRVSKGQRLAAVTDPSQVRLTLEIPAQDLRAIQRDMPGEFRISGNGEAVAVQVRGISPFVDPATGTATCELELAPAAKTTAVLAPGVLGQVSFRANVRKGYNVPDHAIIYKGKDPYLRLLESDKAKLVAIKLGRKQRGFVEILEGLSGQASVVERASKYVADGDTVQVEGDAEGERK